MRAGRRPLSTQAVTGVRMSKVSGPSALDKYPGATVDRVETDSDGAYEAHIVTKADDSLEVEVDKGFNVTGSETFPARGDGGHHEGRGDFESSTANGR